MQNKIEKSCRKELASLARREAAFGRAAQKEPARWKETLAARVPEKVYTGLQSAFSRAFLLIFEKGTAVIDKTYSKTNLTQNHQVQDFAVKLKGNRRELRRMRRMAEKSNRVNTAVTTVEGIGLGALGVGLPDIVVFIGFLLRGAYESAMRYGFNYTAPRERLLILRMMEAALARADDYTRRNAEVDALLIDDRIPTEDELREQIRRTSDAFAVDMLVLKFVQGLPIVGIIGGLGNPVYYRKILRYVQMKNYRRYLLGLLAEPHIPNSDDKE